MPEKLDLHEYVAVILMLICKISHSVWYLRETYNDDWPKISLLFNNWINSDLIYVNDILDENGEISHNFILNRLNNKSNWITEFTIMKKAIPKEWVDIIKTENSKKV